MIIKRYTKIIFIFATEKIKLILNDFMKKFSFVIALSFSLLFLGCSNLKGNQEKGKTSSSKTEVNTSNVKPEQLTYNEFLKKVWNFEKHPKEWIFEGSEPCVIDFYATWCGPCKRLAPMMDEMAKTFNGKVKFYRVDVDKQPKLAALFRIQSIPAVLFTPKNGKPMMQVGLMPHDSYIKVIKKYLLSNKQTTK